MRSKVLLDSFNKTKTSEIALNNPDTRFFIFCFLNYTHVRIEQIFAYRVKHAYISRIPLERFNTSDKGETISTRGFILVRVIDVDRDYRADELEQILVLDVDRTRSRNRSRV